MYYEESDWEADYRIVYYDNCGMMQIVKMLFSAHTIHEVMI